MKRLALASLAWFVFSVGSIWAASYGGGSGTSDDPYQIWTPEQMNTIGANSGDWDKCFKLMANIDMSSYIGTQYNIIGNSTTKFTGTFDGDGNVIRNLTYTTTTAVDYVGLFGYTSNATIKNLGVENVSINTVSITTGNKYAGGLVGYQSSGTIANCNISGSVSSKITNSSSGSSCVSYAGGLVGYQLSGTIMDIYSTGTITSSCFALSSQAYAGGLVGYQSSGTITHSSNSGSISSPSSGAYGSSSGSYAGGLVGYQLNGTITDSHNMGSITSMSKGGGLVGYQSSGTITYSSNTGAVNSSSLYDLYDSTYAGGLVGYQSSGTITYSSSTGSITSTATKDTFAGGLVGFQSSSTITNCYSTGSVSSSNANTNFDVICSYAGGLVGTQYAGSITNCYSTGSVNAYSNSNAGAISYAGGLVGNQSYNYGIIICCYSTGAITASANGSKIMGGLVGSGGNVINSFWDIQTSGLDYSGGGNGRTTTQLKQSVSYIGWNTSAQSNWTLDEGNDYPRLVWESRPGTPLSAQTFSDFVPGTGTADNPYRISTPQQLNIIGLFPDQWNKVFRLENDIDFDSYTGTEFNRIGVNESKYFSGTFDGNGYVIHNLTYTTLGAVGYVGLFGYTKNATIQNLDLENVNISIKDTKTTYAGGLVGYQWHGSITSCYSTGSVSSSSSSWLTSSCVGGLVGYQDYGSTITYCHSMASVTSYAASSGAGGLVGGQRDSTIAHSYSGGSVSSSDILYYYSSCCAGGLVGGQTNSTITHSYSTALVNSSSSSSYNPCYAGGLVGGQTYSTITNSYNTGSVTASSHGYSAAYAGGLVGKGLPPSSITNCYNTASVSSSSSYNSCAGGLLGYEEYSWGYYASIEKCYSTGQVSATGDNAYKGGLLGYHQYVKVTACLWDTQTSGLSDGVGNVDDPVGVQGRTTAQMKDINTYLNVGWDFLGETTNGTADIWILPPGRYPVFSFFQVPIVDLIEIIIEEGQTITFNTFLLPKPAIPVEVKLLITGENAFEILTATTLLFDSSNYDQPQTVSMRANLDDNYLNDKAVLRLQTSNYVLEIPITEKDVQPLVSDVIVTSQQELTVQEMQDATFTVCLRENPLGPITLDLSIQGDQDIKLVSSDHLNFDSSNYNQPQTVTIHANPDVNRTNDTSAVIISSVSLQDSLFKEVDVSEKDIGGYLSGQLPVGETIISESEPVILDNAQIPVGGRLVVGGGTVFKLIGGSNKLQVNGELVIGDAADNPAILTSIKDDSCGGDTNGDGNTSIPTIGDWQGIEVSAGGKVSLENAEIRYAKNGIDTSGQNTNISIKNTKIVYCQQYGVCIDQQAADLEVKTSEIAKNGSGGIYLFSNDSFLIPKRFYHCSIVDNTGPGIYFGGCKAEVKSSIIAFNRSGIQCANAETSELEIQFSNLYNPGWSNVTGITYDLNLGRNILLDPLFVNRTGGDFNLSENSPAIDSAWTEGIETDILLRPLYDDKGIANTGRGGCWFGDMGAYERQQDSQNADLKAVYLSSPGNPVVTWGQTIEVNWTVANQGNLDTTGTWTDKLFLSKDGYLGDDDLFLGQAEVTSIVAAGQSYEKSLSVTIPQLQGVRYLLLAVDAGKQCDKAFRDNNIITSVKPLLIDLPLISMASPLNNTISNKVWNYYLFNNPSGNNVKISFLSNAGAVFKVCAIAYSLPNLENKEFSSDSAGGAADLIIPADTNDLVIGVYGENVSPSPSPLGISVKQAVMTIRSVSPLTVGNKGNATIRLEGESISPDCEFYLDNGQGGRVKASVLPDMSDVLRAFFLEFDLSNAPQGLYELSAVDSAKGLNAIYPQKLTVSNSSLPEFKASLQFPGIVRPLFVANLKVNYENKGLNDIHSPLLTLVGPEGTQWQLPGEDTWTESTKCKFLALSTSGWTKVLRPGQQETINVKMRLPSTYTAATVNIKLFSLGAHTNDGSEREQDWVFNVSDPNVIVEIGAVLGKTHEDYIKILGQCAARLGLYGNLVYSVNTLGNYTQFMPSLKSMSLEEHWSPDAQNSTSNDSDGENYIYDYNKTTVYEWDGTNWVVPSPGKLFPGTTAIIIHGWNATLDTIQWEAPYARILRDTARELKMKVDHVLGIGWNSRGPGITPEMLENLPIPLPLNDPTESANRIPSVAEEAYKQLQALQIEPGKTHIIGHSHGAWVAGRIGNYYGGQINRITALDASTPAVHEKIDWGKTSAQFVDFYRSSWLESSFSPAWGHDNFILTPTNETFGNYDGAHGYPIIWFTNTIKQSNSRFGYNWKSSGNRAFLNNIIPHFTGNIDKPWIGTIRGNGDSDDVCELMSLAYNTGSKKYKAEETWNYPGCWDSFWIDPSNTDKTQTRLIVDTSRTVEFECEALSIIPSSKTWTPEESGKISYTVHNYADNKSFMSAETQILVHTLYLSIDQDLDIHSDYLIGKIEHTLDDFIDCNQTKTIEKEFRLPSKIDIRSNLNLKGNSVDGKYYLILDLCSTRYPDYKHGELYPVDNIAVVPIIIDEDDFYADMGFDEKTYYLGEGQSTVSVSLSANQSSPIKDILNGNIKVEWYSNNVLIGEGMNITTSLAKGRYSIQLKLIDSKTGEESTDKGIIIVKDKDTDGHNEDDQTTRTRQSIDPEDKFGPAGYDDPNTPDNEMKRFISSVDFVGYRIEFWNASSAELPAAIASMEDIVDKNVFDINTLRFTRIGFLKWDIDLNNATFIDKLIDCRPEMNILVHVTAECNTVTGKVNWRFETLDPETGLLPDDPMGGFLPPFNPNTGYELGWMEYKVDPLPGLQTGTVIANQAFGEFDDSGEIALRLNPAPKNGPWINTIDSGLPTSSVNPLPAQSSAQFTLSWQGQDDVGGSGVGIYDIYVSENNGPFTLWMSTAQTSAVFNGNPGSTYAFYSIARDNAGNEEVKQPSVEAQTHIMGNLVDIVSWQLVSKKRVGRTIFDYQIAVTVKNNGTEGVSNLTMDLVNMPNVVTALDSSIKIASIGAGKSVTSQDTFTLRIDASQVLSALTIKCRLGFDAAGVSRQWLDFIGNAVVTADAVQYTSQGVHYLGDIVPDGRVDVKDLIKMANAWLTNDAAADIAPPPTGDGEVNMLDFAQLSQDWLKSAQ